MSRLKKRVEALERRQRPKEPGSALKLMTTDELRRALALVERGGLLPNGEVRRPEVYQEAPPEEWEALERWMELCGEPLDHLEAAEGWRSPEAVHAALLLERLELPDASPWLVGKTAEAVVSFYAGLEEHRDEPRHPELRAAVRRLERLKEIEYVRPAPGHPE
jgi:hypothetical protein